MWVFFLETKINLDLLNLRMVRPTFLITYSGGKDNEKMPKQEHKIPLKVHLFFVLMQIKIAKNLSY